MAVAKGEIRNISYPLTAIQGANILVECRVYNSGELAGTFKVALYHVTLFDVQDYDENGSCYIGGAERDQAILDRDAGKITPEEADAVIAAYNNSTNVCTDGIVRIEIQIAQTSTWLQSAKTTTGIKTLTVVVPNTDDVSVTYMLKCIRMV